MALTAKNRKVKGSRNERRIRDVLESRGYSVTKAGGSLGVWDLVGHLRDSGIHYAESVQWIVFVQVKSLSLPSPAEVRAMFQYVDSHYAINVGYYVARWGKRLTKAMRRDGKTRQQTSLETLLWYRITQDGLVLSAGPHGEDPVEEVVDA